MTTKKLILLDIDGVLSIEKPVSPDNWELGHISYADNYSGTLKTNIPNKKTQYRTHTYRPEIISSLDNLVANFDVEIKFLTNWGAAAKDIFSVYVGSKLISPMDSDAKELGVPTFADAASPIHWYKAQAVIREANERGREVLFVDDLINTELALEFDKVLPKNAGWLKVDPRIGLTPEWIQRIMNWAEGGPSIRKHSIEAKGR
jgi:hypothetical protein